MDRKKPPWPGLPDDYFENPYRSPLTKGELYEWEHDPEEVFEQEILFALAIAGLMFFPIVIGVSNRPMA